MAELESSRTKPLQPIERIETQINYLFDHLVAVGKSGNEQGELWDPSGIAIDNDTNQIYITEGDFSSARVSIFSDTGEFLSMFRHGYMVCPWGIAIHQDNLYITDILKCAILHFKVKEDIPLIAKMGCEGSGNGQFDYPNQLCVSANGDVFVSDRENHRIQILDSSLRYSRQISHHSMKHPCDVKLTPDEVYVLSFSGSHCLHVFSYTGDKIRSIITRGDGLQVAESHFFCMDPNKNIVISDKRSNQIKILSKEGALLHTVGEHGHSLGMFMHPYGIAITQSCKLIVVSLNDTYGLQIFSTSII